jgi:cytochrome oxidase Cu insertion factor (SCO1/SenC/PrrC family)/thiol-disulfide isomerase/thioredoxin
MPVGRERGIAVNWIAPGALMPAAVLAVHQLRHWPAFGGVAGPMLQAGRHSHLAGPRAPELASAAIAPAVAGSSADNLVAIIVAALAVVAGLAFLTHRRLGRWPRPRLRMPRSRSVAGVSVGVIVLAGAAIVALLVIGPSSTPPAQALAGNPYLDPGTPLSRPAPNFTLTDQFGRHVSLSAYRGKVVVLAFNDSECTTICPLTTTAMLDAKAMLGKAGSQVQLLGIDANPDATSVHDVFSYSQVHGMLGSWHFLTGSVAELKNVWEAYDIEVAIQAGEIDHTPALFVIDPQGRERELYLTQQSYAAVGQLGQLLAKEASRLLPSHPRVDSNLSYTQISGIAPNVRTTVPRAGGGSVRLGPGRPRVYVFFATWDQEVLHLGAGLEGLNAYNKLAPGLGLPSVEAVDEGSVEPPGALSRFMASLPRPLSYPVAVDRSGRLGDGYEVQDLPWLMVVSATGRIAWYYDASTLGWPSTKTLITRVRQALAYVAATSSSAAARADLAGSPPVLATLHAQADRLLGSEPALAARIRALRGYPVVVNAWASWCVPCRSEFTLFAAASAHYGRQVAFLGADTDDSAGDAESFLAAHPVSYPSYTDSSTDITQIIPQGVAGLPTTMYFNRAGKLVYVHTGQYDAQGTLDGDIATYALGG